MTPVTEIKLRQQYYLEELKICGSRKEAKVLQNIGDESCGNTLHIPD